MIAYKDFGPGDSFLMICSKHAIGTHIHYTFYTNQPGPGLYK